MWEALEVGWGHVCGAGCVWVPLCPGAESSPIQIGFSVPEQRDIWMRPFLGLPHHPEVLCTPYLPHCLSAPRLKILLGFWISSLEAGWKSSLPKDFSSTPGWLLAGSCFSQSLELRGFLTWNPSRHRTQILWQGALSVSAQRQEGVFLAGGNCLPPSQLSSHWISLQQKWLEKVIA